MITTFAFIAVNQDIELWTIKQQPNELISLHQLPLLRYRQQRRLLLKLRPFHNNRENLSFAFSRLQKPTRFFISVLILTPANSVEVSNKHLVIRCIVKFNELSDDPKTLFDTGATGETFMDKRYAQQQGFSSIPLIKFIPLQGFDGNATGSGPVTHFVYILFAPPGHKPQLTRFFLIDIPQFPIMIGLPWMRSKFTTIRLKPDVSTIDFKKLDKINEPVNTPETMEINSLTKPGNYQFPSVEKIPDEGEPEELQPFKKRKLPGQRSQERKKGANFEKRGKVSTAS